MGSGSIWERSHDWRSLRRPRSRTLPISALPETDLHVRRRDTVLRWCRIWDAQDIEKLVALYHLEAVLHLPGGPTIPFGGMFRGHAGIRQAHEIAWSTCQTEPTAVENFSLHCCGDSVILNGTKGLRIPNGEIVSLAAVQIFKFAGDLIIDHLVQYDTLRFVRLLQDLPPTDETESSR